MKIAIIGSRGWSYAGVEDMVREFGPRLVRDGHHVVVHGWATDEMSDADRHVFVDGVEYLYHRTTRGKFTAQMVVAMKASVAAARSDCDRVLYLFIQNAIWSWIPRLAGKKIMANVDGIMWKDPKWPWGIRHIFFPLGAYWTMLIGHCTITDSANMQRLYKRRFGVDIGWIGYGCNPVKPEPAPLDLADNHPRGYYLIMSRITPHNSTRELVEGFLRSGSERTLLLAGHTPENAYVAGIKRMAEGRAVHFLGLIKDQDTLTRLIQHARAYLHGHSLGGINPALVRVVGLDVPALCVDTVYNREVVEEPNHAEQAVLFSRDPDAVAEGIRRFEKDEQAWREKARALGATVRRDMSWENIYQKYLDCLSGL